MIGARLQPQPHSADEVERRLAALRAGHSLNAIISVNPHVMNDAQHCDRLWRTGTPLGALHGIPLVIKDNIDCAGLPTTAGRSPPAARQAPPEGGVLLRASKLRAR